MAARLVPLAVVNVPALGPRPKFSAILNHVVVERLNLMQVLVDLVLDRLLLQPRKGEVVVIKLPVAEDLVDHWVVLPVNCNKI